MFLLIYSRSLITQLEIKCLFSIEWSYSLDPHPDAVLSGPGQVTDEILRIVKFSLSVSILTGATSPAITVKVERPLETHMAYLKNALYFKIPSLFDVGKKMY